MYLKMPFAKQNKLILFLNQNSHSKRMPHNISDELNRWKKILALDYFLQIF